MNRIKYYLLTFALLFIGTFSAKAIKTECVYYLGNYYENQIGFQNSGAPKIISTKNVVYEDDDKLTLTLYGDNTYSNKVFSVESANGLYTIDKQINFDILNNSYTGLEKCPDLSILYYKSGGTNHITNVTVSNSGDTVTKLLSIYNVSSNTTDTKCVDLNANKLVCNYASGMYRASIETDGNTFKGKLSDGGSKPLIENIYFNNLDFQESCYGNSFSCRQTIWYTSNGNTIDGLKAKYDSNDTTIHHYTELKLASAYAFPNNVYTGSIRLYDENTNSGKAGYASIYKKDKFTFCGSDGVRKTFNVLHVLVKIAKYLIPLIIIISASIKFYMVVIDGQEKALNEAIKSFIIMIVVAVLVFFIPVIVNSIVNLAGQNFDEFEQCAVCFTKGC